MGGGGEVVVMSDDAELFGRQEIEKAKHRVLPAPSAPMAVARTFAAARYTADDGPADGAPTLRHWRGGWWRWDGPHWTEVEQRTMAAAAYQFTENAVYKRLVKGETVEAPWDPNRHKIADLLDALAAITHLPESVAMPGWLDGHAGAALLVSCANGLLDVHRRILLPHDPRFFNATSVPFDYEPDAPPPSRWHQFLEELWGQDIDSIAALAEWFGYVISGRLDMHKILLIVGPTRAGKGVICRTLGQLVGVENTAGPTLSSLNGDFGLAPLLGKTLAVVSDARLNGRGAHVVVERLLSISGEDVLTVNRKYRDQWTGKLPCRLMLCSNELPQLGDASMAVAGRFVPLLLDRSFYDQEDHSLEDTIAGELPGILNWSLDGLEQLTRQDRFTRPPGMDDTLRALQDLASPVAAFVRDCCVKGPEETVAVDDLWTAWSLWAENNGHAKGNKQTFGRNLKAAVAGRLKVERPRDGDARHREYSGIGLTDDAALDVAKHEAEQVRPRDTDRSKT
jgi:putative DNA primase/helicase